MEKGTFITIEKLELSAEVAIKIMNCLKKYEPEIHDKLRQEIKLNTPD